VRISGQLIDTDTGHHVWAERYDRVLADIFTLQDEITDAIVTALEAGGRPLGAGQGAAERHPGSRCVEAVSARRLVCRSIYPDSFKEAGKLCLAASERDAQFSTPLAFAPSLG